MVDCISSRLVVEGNSQLEVTPSILLVRYDRRRGEGGGDIIALEVHDDGPNEEDKAEDNKDGRAYNPQDGASGTSEYRPYGEPVDPAQ